MDMFLVMISLTAGGVITWLISRHYYKRGTSDFAKIVSGLDNVVSQEASQENNIERKYIDSTSSSMKAGADQVEGYTFPRVVNVVNEVERVFKKYGTREAADIGGFTISELHQLSDRVNKIAELLKDYAHWRTHAGD